MILMGGQSGEFKRLDQILSDGVDSGPVLRPWEKYRNLSLPHDYSLSEGDDSLSAETADFSSSESCSESDASLTESDIAAEEEEVAAHSAMQRGDIVHWPRFPQVLFVVGKTPENGWIQLLSPDNSRQTTDIKDVRLLLNLPLLHKDTTNQEDLRFRQSLLERLTECQLDYLLSCME